MGRIFLQTPSRVIVALCGGLALASCSSDEQVEAKAMTESAIINGSPSVPDNSSFVRLSSSGCTGSLIRNDWVLTAKHCLNTGEAEDPSITDAVMGSQSATARRIALHKNYDVGLVELETPLEMNGSTAGWFRDLHRNPTSELDDVWLGCYGYGRNSFDDGGGILRYGDIRVSEAHQDSYELTPNPSNGQIKWLGDSGGPCFLVDNAGARITGVSSSGTYDEDDGEVLSNVEVAANRFRDWAMSVIDQDAFGGVMVSGDFNEDGLADLAIGAPKKNGSGRVHVFRGSSSGFTLLVTLDQSDHGAAEEDGDRFGAGLAAGDFDGDGCDDLAVGAPGESVGGARAGHVFVFRGTAASLVPFTAFSQTGFGSNEDGDELGAALAAGDFDDDGRDDLAVGAPGEAPGSALRSGVVFVLRATTSGFTHHITLQPATEVDDRFGHALVTGDFNADGRADLAVSAPGAGSADAGNVTIYRASTAGIGGSSQTLSQVLFSTPVPVTDNETGDLFGWSLASGDFDDDGRDDLAVGAPGEVLSGAAGAGAVWIFRSGSSSFTYDAMLTQAGLGSDEHGDFFGGAVAAGDLDGDGFADLIVGAPSEAAGSGPEAGYAFTFRGGSSGLTAWLGFSQIGAPGEHDRFGGTIVSGDFNGDGRDDIVIARPGDAAADLFRGIAGGLASHLIISSP